ncbi:MAG: hypothetical protein LBE76_03690 [Nitrososphaerota archaeon]|jgi:hypothetical protein|nr:hypothetical protein [Nitrososphaerota archaeon]
MKKITVLVLLSLIVCFSIFALFSSVGAEQIVGVKEGDWVEYDIAVTGVGSMPPTHDVRWSRMEVLAVDGSAFSVNVSVRYANESFGSSVWKFNFTEGKVGGWLIIPANLGVGDTFFDAYSEPNNVPIQGEEQRTVLGATRTVTRGSDALREIKEWDKSTGFFISSKEVAKNYTNAEGWYFEDLTITIRATATNMWGRQIFGLDTAVFALVISSLVFAVVALVSALIIWQRKNLAKLSLRYSSLTKKVILAVIIVSVVVSAAIVVPSFWMNLGLSNAEGNMIMQSIWFSLILASVWFRKTGNYFVHGILMTAVVICTLIGFASVIAMWSPADSSHMELVYFSSFDKIAEFVVHGVFSIPALVFGCWFIALWRLNSVTFPNRSKLIVKLLVIMWALSYIVGVLGYIIDYTTLLGSW